MKKKKILALVLAASMAGGMLAGCGATSSGDETAKGDKSSGKVYYLNFKPEQADQWVELAKEYTDETGVQVDVQTAASGTYESQLKSEMAKDEAPTLFQDLLHGKIIAMTFQTAMFIKMSSLTIIY